MKKTATAIVFALFATTASAETVDNKFVNWLIAEKNKIVEYQTKSWENGKAQLARNKTQLTGFFSKLNLKSEEQ